MNKINIDNWKEFKISEIFLDLRRGALPIFRNLNKGEMPVIAASMFNQGITGYYDVPSLEKNRITVSLNGVGSGYFAYHDYEFAANSDCGILIEKYQLNKYSAMFLCAILNKIGTNYGYEEKVTKPKLFEEVILLPATPTGEPDFQYMEEYIKNVEELQNRNLQIIKSLIPPPSKNVNTVSWKYFQVLELFEVISGKGITKQEIYEHAGELPAIQSGEENFGRIGYLDYNYCVSKKYAISKGECLTVARSGSSGFVGYQPKQCVVGDSAKILEPKFEANTKRLLYIRALLMVNKSSFAYTDKVTTSNYENSSFPLPVTPSGEPDFQYMEQTITALIAQQQTKLQLTQTTFEKNK